MSKENQIILENINSRRNSNILRKLRQDIPDEVLDVMECSIIDANKHQFIPVNPIYILELFEHIKLESFHISGKDYSPSESFLNLLLDEIEREVENQKNITLPGVKSNYISDAYDINDPIAIHNTLVVYTKDKRWIDVGDYLIELHNNRFDSPYHMDYQDIRFMKNGRMVKLFNYSRDNLKPYLDDLCIYLSSYSNYVRWSYRE